MKIQPLCQGAGPSKIVGNAELGRIFVNLPRWKIGTLALHDKPASCTAALPANAGLPSRPDMPAGGFLASPPPRCVTSQAAAVQCNVDDASDGRVVMNALSEQ